MNRHAWLLAFLMTILIPGIVYGYLGKCSKNDCSPESTVTADVQPMCVSVLAEDRVIQMKLEEYIQGVLLGEIPDDFNTEALKAQAVASRTYALKQMCRKPKHEEAYLCVDPSCCQAYVSETAYLDNGGTKEYLYRVRDAVESTAGEVLLYNGQLIEATYFAASGGRTEAAVEVWGQDVPYLQSVDSPGEQVEKYDGWYTQLSIREFLEKMGLSERNLSAISCNDIRYTSGNGVATINICGKVYSGKDVRERLGLPSTAFEISISDDRVTIHTDGHGHRVGLSQYGADAMASKGTGYYEILAHYYPETTIHLITEEEIKGVFDKAGNL